MSDSAILHRPDYKTWTKDSPGEDQAHLPESHVAEKKAFVPDLQDVLDDDSIKRDVKNPSNPMKTNDETFDIINKLRTSFGSEKPGRKKLPSTAIRRSNSVDKIYVESDTSSPARVKKASVSSSRKQSNSEPVYNKQAKPDLPDIQSDVKHPQSNDCNIFNAAVNETCKDIDLIVITDVIGNTGSDCISFSMDPETLKKSEEAQNRNTCKNKPHQRGSKSGIEKNYKPILEEIPLDKNSPEDQVTWATLVDTKKGIQQNSSDILKIFKNETLLKTEISGISEINIKNNLGPFSSNTVKTQSELHKNDKIPKTPIDFDETARTITQHTGLSDHEKSKKIRSALETTTANNILEHYPTNFDLKSNTDIANTELNEVNTEPFMAISSKPETVNTSTNSKLIPMNASEVNDQRRLSNLKWALGGICSESKKVANKSKRKEFRDTDAKKVKESKRGSMSTTKDFTSSSSEATTKHISNLPHLKTVKSKVDDKGGKSANQPKSKNYALLNKEKAKLGPNPRSSQFTRSVKPLPAISISEILQNTTLTSTQNTTLTSTQEEGSKNPISTGQVLKPLRPPASRVTSSQASKLGVLNPKYTGTDKNKLLTNLKPKFVNSNKKNSPNDNLKNNKEQDEKTKYQQNDSKEGLQYNFSDSVDTVNKYADPQCKIYNIPLLSELLDNKNMKDLLQDGTTSTDPFVTVLTNTEILNLRINLEVKNTEGTVTAKINSRKSLSATNVNMGITDEVMGQSKSMDSIDGLLHICCQRTQKGHNFCACCDHFTHEDAGRNELMDQNRKTYYMLVPVQAFTKQRNQEKPEETEKSITGCCCSGDDEQSIKKNCYVPVDKEVQHSISPSKINVVSCAKETSTIQVVSEEKAQNCNTQSSKTSVLDQAITKKVSICSDDKIIHSQTELIERKDSMVVSSQTEIISPPKQKSSIVITSLSQPKCIASEKRSNCTSMGVIKQDKSVQTDTCNLIMEVRRHEDGRYTFHLPPLEAIKRYCL